MIEIMNWLEKQELLLDIDFNLFINISKAQIH